MRLLIISDIHGHLENICVLSDIIKRDLPHALVICGDITHFGDLANASIILKEFANLAATFFVPGNCDPPQLAAQLILEGATNIHGRCLGLPEINLLGIGGSIPTPFGTPFEITDNEVSKILDIAQKNCSGNRSMILISHNPPYNTKADATFIGNHVGSKSIRNFIEKTSPALTICGHVHESRAIDSLGATTIVNPGPFHKGYFALAEIGEKISVKLEELK
ncbi:metallophosphoesterase [Candidatus Bathyarchaeota archaeon]|nr:metallophosphoesterase [Candidatus Bathyarchaeota archaeon]